MGKLQGQAFDTEKLYNQLGITQLEEYARTTGLLKDGKNLDGEILLNLSIGKSSRLTPRILEVGCGYGRIGLELMKYTDYFGIELNQNYVDEFKANTPENLRDRIMHGNFLEDELNVSGWNVARCDAVLFPWSGIADFDIEGQEAALRRSYHLLVPKGKIYVDVPKDIVNKLEGYQPAPFNVHEVHDLNKIGLRHVENHSYQTHTGRNREIIEMEKPAHFT